MINFELTFDFKEFEQLSSVFQQFSAALFPNSAAIIEKKSNEVAQAWRNFVSRENNDLDIEFPKDSNLNGGKLAESVKAKPDTDILHWKVSSDSKMMDQLINGSPEVKYDMKQTHTKGRKSRVSAKGIPYLIIPFRWGTPNDKGSKRRWNNSIPQVQYNTLVKGMKISSTKNTTHIEPNAKGEPIVRPEYNWKSRLSSQDAWNDRASGMVRMKDTTGSTYWTFRIVSAKSPANSWWYKRPATQGVDIIAALHRRFDAEIESELNNAVAEDEKWLKGQFD